MRERYEYDYAHEHGQDSRGYKNPVLVLSEAVIVLVIEEGKEDLPQIRFVFITT